MIHPQIVKHVLACGAREVLVVEPTSRVAADTHQRVALSLMGSARAANTASRTVELKDGRIITVAAADNADALRGRRFDRAVVCGTVPETVRDLVSGLLPHDGAVSVVHPN